MHHTWLGFLLGLGRVSPCLGLEGASVEEPEQTTLGFKAHDQTVVWAPAEDVEAKLKFQNAQDSVTFYQKQKQAIWPEVWNKGPAKAAKLVIESAELKPLGLSITEVYAFCPGTKASDGKIRCEWTNVDSSFHAWSKITLQLSSDSSSGSLGLPLTLTSYVQDEQTGRLRESDRQTHTYRWEKREPATYKQADASKFPQSRTLRIVALPEAEEERKRLRQWFRWADFQATGFYLNPRAKLTVTVSGVQEGGPQPQMLIGTPVLVDPENRRAVLPSNLVASQALKNGANTVSNPYGGIIYIRHTGPAGALPADVTVTMAKGPAAPPFPLFRPGQTTKAEWQEMLKVTQVPFAELSGWRVMVTGLAADAKLYADKGQDPQALLKTYAGIIAAEDAISGLNKSAAEARDRTSRLRPMIVQSTDTAYPNAWHYRAAIPAAYRGEVWSQAEVAKSWMIWHELGHQRQHSDTWSWGALSEVTVNIYSLAARRLVPDTLSKQIGHATVEEWEAAKAFVAKSAGDDKVFDTTDHFVRLVMFEQLRVAFGDGFYHRLHKASRAGPVRNGDADKKHYFMTQAARIANVDLGGYFVKWGLQPEERTLDAMKKLPRPSKDYTTVPVYGVQSGRRDL